MTFTEDSIEVESPENKDTPLLSIAQTVPFTEAEGPGKRFAIWFQGCPFRCPGCCNPEMLSFRGGVQTPLGDLLDQIRHSRETTGVEGITLLGGEPLAHARGAAVLASSVRQMGMTVMVFTGYLLEEARESQDPDIAALLKHTDILVDGKYDRDLPETKRRWIGSSNQRIHFLTNRYQMDDSWSKSNTLEIRLNGGSLTVNGFPSGSAVGLWKKPPRPSTSGRSGKDSSP